ncbi:helicase associated domain-containing protein [Rhodococcus sp. NPDC059968]|uniref:helicase associated domain-containing protein n=1 Tax=Rhodococcus sp. NPDC059968 TaxID=3347017 RepID=UPI003670C137
MHDAAGIRDDYVCSDGYRLGKWVGKQRTKWAALPADRKRRLEELPGWTLDARSALWEASFTALTHYVQENGHANPPRGLIVDGINLETWIRRQRRMWDRLTVERRQRLQAVPGWTRNVLDDKWNVGYRYLLQHVEEVGSAEVLQSFVSDDGYPLGRWVSVQRRIWDDLSEERRQKLTQLPGWTLDARGGWWEAWFRSLEEYVSEHGHARVPDTYVTDGGAKLGSWVSNQRSTWQAMSDERRDRLQQLPGWTLNSRTDSWEDWFCSLEQYVARHGNARVPQAYVTEDGTLLGSWVANQKTKWQAMSDERRHRLEQLPGWTLDTKVTRWEEGYEQLLAYVGENDTAQVRADCIVDGFRLGQWVTTQRANWASLSEQRRERLVAVPGWTASVRDTRWEEGYQQIQRYVDKNGHARPPQKYVDASGFKLGTWVASQRQSFAKGQLNEVRCQRLAKLPGWEWKTRSGSRIQPRSAPM